MAGNIIDLTKDEEQDRKVKAGRQRPQSTLTPHVRPYNGRQRAARASSPVIQHASLATKPKPPRSFAPRSSNFPPLFGSTYPRTSGLSENHNANLSNGTNNGNFEEYHKLSLISQSYTKSPILPTVAEPLSQERDGSSSGGTFSSASPGDSTGNTSDDPFVILDEDDDERHNNQDALVSNLSAVGHNAVEGEEIIDLEEALEAELEAELIDEDGDDLILMGIRPRQKEEPTSTGEREISRGAGQRAQRTSQASRSKARRKSSVKIPQRNPTIEVPLIAHESYNHSGLRLFPKGVYDLEDGGFIRIVSIVENLETEEVSIRGQHFQRVRDVHNMLPRKLNEVCAIVDIDLDDSRPGDIQAMIEVPISQILPKRRLLGFRNQDFPMARLLNLESYGGDQNLASADGPLTCRWRFTTLYNIAKQRVNGRATQKALERITATEVLNPADNSALRYAWRGKTIPGGSYIPEMVEVDAIPNQSPSKRKASDENGVFNDSTTVGTSPKRSRPDSEQQVEDTRRRFSVTHLDRKGKAVDLTSDDDDSTFIPSIPPVISSYLSESNQPPPTGAIVSQSPAFRTVRKPGQKLTFGDSFCGCGGTTSGAQQAGFRVVWGFDMWDEAMKSWKTNFPMAAGYTLRADEFINKAKIGEIKNVKVDVVHLSPPCQYFSPAHTHKGPNDEMNTASLFAVGELLAVAKPRIVTLEQTWGLLWERYQDYFHALIHMFTSHGYSVRWSLVHFQDWGLPASRRRLIIIASCPGESLPTMPPPTHALDPPPGSRLRPFTTVNQALSSIPANHPLKNALGNTLKTPKREWVGNVIMKQAMTCNGGGNYHMSGLRDFDLAEYAALQGFPMDFKFRGSNNTNIKKQMGNAIPPSVARRLFEWIKKWLDRVDGIVEETIVIN